VFPLYGNSVEQRDTFLNPMDHRPYYHLCKVIGFLGLHFIHFILLAQQPPWANDSSFTRFLDHT